MKRPPSVITTLVLFAFFILIFILTVVKNSPDEIGKIMTGAVMPALFLVGWVGVFLKKNWARIYSAVLVVLLSILILALPFINKAEQAQKNELIILSAIMFCFLSWWAFSLLKGKASKAYFLHQEHNNSKE